MLPFTDLTSFLVWLIGPGLPVAVGITMSLLLSRFDFWKKVPSDIKAAIPFIVAVVYAYVGNVILNTPDIVNNFDANFIFSTILVYYSSQVKYDSIKYKKLRDAYLAEFDADENDSRGR